MQFPIFQVPYLGNGLTIALDGIVHVVISHGFAIGAMAIIVLSEYLGFKNSSRRWESFAKDFLRFSVIIITGVGAVTGVGLWLITSALSPRSIGSMLRVFFWPWFLEWIVFSLEVSVLLIYYFLWDRWSAKKKKQHIRLGFSYVLLALFSAVLITGILGFMLTPDGWPWNKSFWAAFFNPSFLPQLLLRTGLSFIMGAVFSAGYCLATRRDADFRREALRLCGKVALVLFAVTAVASAWYLQSIPSRFRTHAAFAILTSKLSQHPELFYLINAAGALILVAFALLSLRGSSSILRALLVPALLFSLGFVSEFERIREFTRGPYLMPGYMYSNQVLLEENPFYNEAGLLKNSFWFNKTTDNPDPIKQGVYLFAQNCSSCHTISGINDIKDRVQGRTEDGIYVILGHTREMVPFMPPFSGTEEERKILAHFFFALSEGEIKLGAPSRFAPLAGSKNE